MDASEHTEADQEASLRRQIRALVLRVPPGRVIAYGVLGSFCQPPLSGYFCGRALGRLGGDLPWWRVVARDGSLPVGRRAPELGQQQRDRLLQEGITLDDTGKIQKHYFISSESELSLTSEGEALYGAAG